MSEALTLRLDAGTLSTDDAARQIATDPALLAEVKAALPSLEHVAAVKAGPEGVKAVIGRRFAYFHVPKLTEGETEAWWGEYIGTLSDVGLASLEAAMRAYVALPDSEFMPKAGRLREMAFTAPTRALSRLMRARAAIAWKDPAQPMRPSPEDQAAIRRMAEETVACLTPPKPAKPSLPSIAGRTDERGITPEMRELLARRA